MTNPTETDEPHPRIMVAENALSIAQKASERGQQKLAETESLLSIAASLRQLCLQNDAALDGQDQLIALDAKSLELVERIDARAAAREIPAEVVSGELVNAGCCCRQEANDAEDLLEYGFGLICNAVNSLTSGARLKAEWEQAARRFIDRYNTRLGSRYGDADLGEREFNAGSTTSLNAALGILDRYSKRYPGEPDKVIAETRGYLTTLLEQWGADAPDWDTIEAEARDELARLKAAESADRADLAADLDSRSARLMTGCSTCEGLTSLVEQLDDREITSLADGLATGPVSLMGHLRHHGHPLLDTLTYGGSRIVAVAESTPGPGWVTPDAVPGPAPAAETQPAPAIDPGVQDPAPAIDPGVDEDPEIGITDPDALNQPRGFTPVDPATVQQIRDLSEGHVSEDVRATAEQLLADIDEYENQVVDRIRLEQLVAQRDHLNDEIDQLARRLGDIGGEEPAPADTPAGPRRLNIDMGDVRRWARENGRPVKPTGKIAGGIIDAYLRAHSKTVS